LPYVMMMIVAIIILSIFPGIATWLPDYLMGVAVGPNPSYSGGMHFELTGMAQSVEPA